MLASVYVPSLPSATAVSVVLMPDSCGRLEPTNPIVSLPHAIASRRASSSGPPSRDLSRFCSAWMIQPLATSPAAAPPPPSPRLVEFRQALNNPPARAPTGRGAPHAVGHRREPRRRVDRVLVVLA